MYNAKILYSTNCYHNLLNVELRLEFTFVKLNIIEKAQLFYIFTDQ